MRLQEILKRNQRFAAGRTPHPLPPPSPAALIVVSCFDPRLDGLMAPALGLEGERVLWFRTAGAFVPRESATIRSLLVKVFLFEVQSILVVGHSSCRMASFDAESFIATFRARGVDRDGFGPGDLRDWAGAIGSPRQGVELTVENILSHPARPADLVVNGAVLDDARGLLEPVGHAPEATERGSSAQAPTSNAVGEASKGLRKDRSSDTAVEALARALRSSAKWRYEVGRLRKELARAEGPASKLPVLVRFVERMGVDSHEVVSAYQQFLRGARKPGEESVDPDALLRQLEHLVMKL